MSISYSGTVPHGGNRKRIVRIVPRKGSTLYVGQTCHDGRPITESWKYKRAVALGIPILALEDEDEKADEGKGDAVKGEESWVDKYRPQRLAEVIGHKSELQEVAKWLAGWNPSGPRGALLTGPPGIGKTTLVHLLAKEAGYAVTEYNASDTRSVAALRGQFALGMRRLRREVIVMDEVDGLCERGGVAELATILRTTTTPIFCIANERGPKLTPLARVCLDVRLRRPMASTIASAMERVVKAEGLSVSRSELDRMVEKSGNDIRAVLNQLAFYKSGLGSGVGVGDKDALHRLDAFSATQRLFASKGMSWETAEELVYVDYHLIPLMVQEAYVSAGQSDMETIAVAAEGLSFQDGIQRVVGRCQEWSLLPHVVAGSVSVAKRVPGNAPFQLFPQLLGKMSKQRKQQRWMEDLTRRVGGGCRVSEMRLGQADVLRTVLVSRLQGGAPDIKGVIQTMDEMRMTREDVMEVLDAVLFGGVVIPTKVKTAFTREWKKGHSVVEVKRVRGAGAEEAAEEAGGSEEEETGNEDGDEAGEEMDGGI